LKTKFTANFELSPQLEEQIVAIAKRYHNEPHQLMKILLDIQKVTSNAIPQEVATVISRETGIPEAGIYGFITFYAMFSTNPRGKYVVRMCESAPCHVTGAKAVMDAIIRTLGIQPGQSSSDGQFTLEYCQCLGVCESSPAILVNEELYTNLTPGRAAALMKDYMRGDVK